MTPIIVTHTLRNLLPSLNQPLVFYDENGNLLGRFTPSKLDPALYENLEPQISEEEIQRRIQAGGGRPLAEILTDLEKRA